MHEPTLHSLDARLRMLEDIEEIRRLRMRYHVCINEQDWGGVVDLYTDDAVVDLNEVAHARGRAEIDRVYRALPGNADFVKQFIHNHLVDVAGDEAEGVSYLDARYAHQGKSLMVAARFKERYQRTEAGWRISETVVDVYFAAPPGEGWVGAARNQIKPWE